MCGLAGLLLVEGHKVSESLLQNMGRAIAHRGPDSSGSWMSDDCSVGLVHQRLAIQDLSEHGHQPMPSSSGRYQLAFNGEVYNFRALAEELESCGHQFNGHSDTEVLLAAFEQWGVVASLPRFSGMFAIAVVDLEENTLTLARDRLGEKPLYYGYSEQGLAFASELKSLRQWPAFKPEINRDSLTLYLRHNFIPAPHTIYTDYYKLMPASYIQVNLSYPTKPVSLNYYWQQEDCFKDSLEGSVKELADQVEEKLDAIISEQMIADAPLGAFLSGGVDSSTVVALMQKQSLKPIKTFTIGFNEPGYNEAEFAKQVAEHLGTDHTELYVTAEDALALVTDLREIYDEPYADSSQIPTLLLAEMTKKHVTVSLSGDGGDELFCGYTRYPEYASGWLKSQSGLRKYTSKLQGIIGDRAMAGVAKLAVPAMRKKPLADIEWRFARQRRLAESSSLGEYYRHAVSYWRYPEQVVKGASEPDYALTKSCPAHIANDPLKELMWRDLNWYLPDDILTKVDRAAMAHSLETRVPMLDHRFVELALQIDSAKNLEAGVGKKVLREVLFRHVPKELIDRPKQGFAVPISEWLRGPLRTWAEDLLDAEKMEQEGYFESAAVHKLWGSHLSATENYAYELWGILMFQSWLRGL